MIVVLCLYLGLLALLLGWLLYERFCPRHVVKRIVKQREKVAAMEGLSREQMRLRNWALAHPDDPTAQAYLNSESSVTVTDDSDGDVQRRLGKAQADADERDRDLADRREAQRVEAELFLAWSLLNPRTDEGRRHLATSLMEARAALARAEHGIKVWEAAEGTEHADPKRLAEARAAHQAASKIVDAIEDLPMRDRPNSVDVQDATN